jgi:hypothetical protein
MSDVNVTVLIQTADRVRKAEVTVPRSMTVSELVEETKKNWKLTGDVSYRLQNVTKGKELAPNEKLSLDLVSDKDLLEIQPLLEAGADICRLAMRD